MGRKKKFNIEEGLERLDEILERMEEQNTELSESFELYEEGMKLLKSVNEQIDEVEQKVMIISNNGDLEEFDRENIE